MKSESVSHSVMPNSLWSHGLWLARFLSPWNSPDKNTGRGCHSLFQEIFPTQGLNPRLLHCRQILYCLSHQGKWKWNHSVVSNSLWPMDCSLPSSSVHGILQARILEWVAISFSRGCSQPRDQTWVSRIGGRCFNLWATREAHSHQGSLLQRIYTECTQLNRTDKNDQIIPFFFFLSKNVHQNNHFLNLLSGLYKAVLLLSQSNFRDYKLCLIPKDDNTVSRRPAFATGRLETELTPCPAL